MALDVSLPQAWDTKSVSLTVTNGTQAKVLVDKQAAAAPLLGGFRLIDGQVASTDGSAKSLIVWQGEELTQVANMGSAQVATTGTMTRDAGSFLTDGWRVGDTAMLVHGPQGPYAGTAANYGQPFQLTAVAALTLTVNGTPLTVEAMQAGARLVRVAQRTRLPVPLNSGNADATPPVALMTGTQNPSSAALPDTGWQFGPSSLLLVSLAANASALPARIDVAAAIARY